MGLASLFYNVIQFIKNMKKIWFIFIVPCFVAIGFSSCSEDTTWRDENLAFIENYISTRDGIYAIGDSINGYPGLYYEVLHDGLGDSIPKIGYKVQISYKMWLYNDTITYDKNHNLLAKEALSESDKYEFTVGGSPEGWTLALQYMAVGDKWRLYIPYYLGYGSTATTAVPAYSTLICDIYLRKVISEN